MAELNPPSSLFGRMAISFSSAASGALILLTVTSQTAHAQNGNLYACVGNSNGQLRLVAAYESCKPNETRVVLATAGSTGPQGPPGPVGPMGPAGPAGATGAVGPVGPAGPVGATGATGAQGPVGATGAQGPVGLTGPQGAPGPQGPAGPTGPVGATGATGETGAIGPQGPAGPVGPQGPIGLTGPAGATGATGPQGPQGLVGPAGPQGLIGLTGATGATGATGPAGPRSTNGQDVVAAYGTAALALTPALPFTQLPGLSVTVTVPANSRVLISTSGGAALPSTALGQFSALDVAVFVDGEFTSNGAYQRLVPENTVIANQPV